MNDHTIQGKMGRPVITVPVPGSQVRNYVMSLFQIIYISSILVKLATPPSRQLMVKDSGLKLVE